MTTMTQIYSSSNEDSLVKSVESPARVISIGETPVGVMGPTIHAAGVRMQIGGVLIYRIDGTSGVAHADRENAPYELVKI